MLRPRSPGRQGRLLSTAEGDYRRYKRTAVRRTLTVQLPFKVPTTSYAPRPGMLLVAWIQLYCEAKTQCTHLLQCPIVKLESTKASKEDAHIKFDTAPESTSIRM